MNNTYDRKQQILDVAMKEFSEKGLYGARINELAEKSGYNKRAVYEIYSSKDEIYSDVLGFVYEQISQAEAEAISHYSSYVDAIKKIISMYFHFFFEHPDYIRLIMWENLSNAAHLNKANAQSKKSTTINFTKKILSQGIAEGVFKPDTDIEETVMSINMFTFSYYSNLQTMSNILNNNLSSKEAMEKRCKYVTDVIISSIIHN